MDGEESRNGWRAGGSKRLLIALSIASAYSETMSAKIRGTMREHRWREVARMEKVRMTGGGGREVIIRRVYSAMELNS